MIDRDALSSRLNALESYITELHACRRYSREDYVRESAVHHLAERFLHLACECTLGTVHHVIADQRRIPRSTSSVKLTMPTTRPLSITGVRVMSKRSSNRAQ